MPMRDKGLTCLAVTVFACCATAAADAPQRWAVVVGINDYADPAIPDLKYAESDAKAVYATLTDAKIGRFPKANVTLLLGKQATNDQIKLALQKLWPVAAGKQNDIAIDDQFRAEVERDFAGEEPSRRMGATEERALARSTRGRRDIDASYLGRPGVSDHASR